MNDGRAADSAKGFQRSPLPPDVRELLVKRLGAALARAWRERSTGLDSAGEHLPTSARREPVVELSSVTV